VLGGPVDPALTRTLATRCDGNVLFLRELVAGAGADGSLRMDDGMWRVVGPLHPSRRLVELVEARLGGLSGQERRLLELVSFGEPLGQAELEKLGDLAIAERLETAGLLRVRFSHGRIEVRLSHPVYGDVLRAGLSEERVAAMARALAEAVESTGVRGTDELLRLYTPTLGLARTVSRDAEFHGQPLCQGDRAILMWAAANRDPAMFENPDQLDLTRANAKKQMAFGVGMHRCLGSHYAKMMFDVMITQILKRLPDFELAEEHKLFEDAGEVYAVRELRVRFTPGPRLN